MTLVEFIVLGLATWRVSSYVVEEEGPFELLAKLRRWIGIRYDENSELYGSNELARQIMCIWCVSVYVGAVLTILWVRFPVAAFYLALPFALSAITIIIHGRGIRAKKLHW